MKGTCEQCGSGSHETIAIGPRCVYREPRIKGERKYHQVPADVVGAFLCPKCRDFDVLDPDKIRFRRAAAKPVELEAGKLDPLDFYAARHGKVVWDPNGFEVEVRTGGRVVFAPSSYGTWMCSGDFVSQDVCDEGIAVVHAALLTLRDAKDEEAETETALDVLESTPEPRAQPACDVCHVRHRCVGRPCTGCHVAQDMREKAAPAPKLCAECKAPCDAYVCAYCTRRLINTSRIEDGPGIRRIDFDPFGPAWSTASWEEL